MEYRYRKTTYKCGSCRLIFDKLRKFSIEKYPLGTDLPFPSRSPDCPQCKKMEKVNFKNSVTDKTHNLAPDDNIRDMCESRQAPSMGMSNRSKAFDATAEMVMQDYDMSDINMNSNMRLGDTCVPKLAPHLEQKVDEVFKPQTNKAAGINGNILNKTLINQINAGVFRSYGGASDVVARQQNSGISVPTKIIHEYNERPK